ncbi:MAG: amidohydrolase [Paludibacteraceae bacterium]
MKISIVQTDIIWADKKANLRRIEEKLLTLSGTTDLAVLPEMFTTGFCTNRMDLAETMEEETVQKLISWAKGYNMAIAGSFIAKENKCVYNRAFFVFPSGKIETADKRHLFSVGGEDQHFHSGNKKLIINYKEFNICVLVCYDVRFPVWSRNVGNEYDMLIYTANFPSARIHAWDTLLVARAIENQAYVCGVNRVGEDGIKTAYSGHSVLLDYRGETILKFDDNVQGTKTAELTIPTLKKFRDRYAFWKDADRFEIV